MYENLNRNLYTPMIKQYLEIKDQYPDTILFYRIGDFYELFFNDAIIGSKELEIVLTAKDAGVKVDRVPMCGVPYHAVEQYIEKLSFKGYKVGIVEQMEEPNGKLVRREVTRIITPGTNIDSCYLVDKENNYLAAIDKKNNNFYLAYSDLSTGSNYVIAFKNNLEQVINELEKLNVREIVVSGNIVKSDIVKLRASNFIISVVENNNVDDYLKDLASDVDSSFSNVTSLLLAYIVETQKRVLLHLKKFEEVKLNNYLKIDDNVARALELVESIDGNRFSNNLFALLDHCETAMGSRLLKKNILYPLRDVDKINYRLNIIQTLLARYSLIEDVKQALNEIYDLERIIGRICFNTLSPKDLLQLKKSLHAVPSLKLSLTNFQSPITNELADSLNEFNQLVELLEKSISEDAPYLLKDGGVIKDGFSKELDDIRHIGDTNKDFLKELEQREKERTGIKGLKVGYNRVFGYYIEITNSYLSELKDEYGYIRKQTTSNSERFITQELKERETLILTSSETALKMEIELFGKIKEECLKLIKPLQNLSNQVSFVDMMTGLADIARTNGYTKPEFNDNHDMYILDGYHPVVGNVLKEKFIPNDTSLSKNDYVLLLTGPNMSGKSTYMRQNALICIMAQIGSYVPAKSVNLPIFDAIFTRIGSSDNLAKGESSFMMEMIEVNKAIKEATKDSLIIFDEVGRGTATYDGIALAQSILEYIHEKIHAKTLFSTHYHELTFLEDTLKHLKNVHVEAKVIPNNGKKELVFMHKVLPGSSDKSYGINVASLAKIPDSITLRADDILNKLVKETQVDYTLLSLDNYVEPVYVEKTDEKSKKIIDELNDFDVNNATPMEAALFIMKLKEEINND